MSTDNWDTVASIVRPQGRRGEVLADLSTDFPESFRSQPEVVLRSPAGVPQPATVEDFWLPTGRSAGRIVLKLRGIESISDAERLTGFIVQRSKNERVPLDNGMYYVSDLTGCVLVDGETELGAVTDMHFPQDSNGKRIESAAAIFVVERVDGDEVMIPFANEFVKSIDLETRRIVMNLPAGLLEMNG